MSLTYSQYVDQLSNLMVIEETNADFVTFLPGCIDYAEQRIYRELDLLANVQRVSTQQLTANSRSFTVPAGSQRFVTIQNVNVVTPAGTNTTTGTRNSLVAASHNMIDFLYPTETAPSSPSVPALYAMITDQTLIVGPAPDAAYLVEVIGTFRPAPLSASNTTTVLTLYLPDLFMAASCVFAFGYMRDFGGQADNPNSSQSWENQYRQLFTSANAEEMRKRFNETYADKPVPAESVS